MISGRGLGHSGGTLDKMDAIAGYTHGARQRALPARRARGGLRDHRPDRGAGPRGPAPVRDPRRDGDGGEIPLITSSILSKKLAAGLAGLVMDVKFGTGAFMATAEDGRALAESVVGRGNGAGCRTTALLTDMNEVLRHDGRQRRRGPRGDRLPGRRGRVRRPRAAPARGDDGPLGRAAGHRRAVRDRRGRPRAACERALASGDGRRAVRAHGRPPSADRPTCSSVPTPTCHSPR